MRKFVLVLLACLLLCGCSQNSDKPIKSIEDLANKNVGFVVGSWHAQYFENEHADLNISNVYLGTNSELLMSLKTGKIDAFAIDLPNAKLLCKDNNDLVVFEAPNSECDSGFIFSNGASDIQKDFNQFLADGKESGFIDEMIDKWLNNPSFETTVKEYDYVPTQRTIKAVTSIDSPPYSFLINDKYQGYCHEILNAFAYEYGYGIDMVSSAFDGILSGISSEKYDIAIDEINITEERKKNLIFSDPINSCAIGIITIKGNNSSVYTDISQLTGTVMGCMSGSVYDRTIEELIKADVSYYNSRSELIMGLKQGKIEGYLADRPVAMVCCNENKGIKYLEKPLQNVEYGFCFSKDAGNIREQFNEYLRKISDDGTLVALQEKWICNEAINKSVDEVELTGENGTIRVCTTPDAAPFSFIKNNRYEGYEVELMTMFAKEYGYNIEIDSISFDAIISAISSSKYDVAFNGIYITEERSKSVDFSNPVYTDGVVAVVRSGEVESMSFIDTLKDKFYSTFIEEDRYKIILNGIYTTLLISAASLLFGTVIGLIIYLLTRKLGIWFTKLNDAIAYIISGMPVVVLLMVLFYIIFAKSKLSGVVISIVGFSLIICYSVYGMLKTGIGNIDKGQFEGALALGYTDNQTLFKFIMPQALRIIMPSYRAEIVSLIKSTSVVGYVTVEDLTRASDLIRSRTYDAFFPLIVTAVIYFALAWIITKVVNNLQIKFLPNEKSKEEILKSIGRK